MTLKFPAQSTPASTQSTARSLNSAGSGAVSLPATELTEAAIRKIAPVGKKIVLYCDDNLLPTRRIALTTLCYPDFGQLGFDEVYVLQELWNNPRCRAEKAPLDGDDPCPRWLPMERTVAATSARRFLRKMRPG